jgi:hypothetical protein
MTWFQVTLDCEARLRGPIASVRVASVVRTEAKRTSPQAVMKPIQLN